MTCIRETTESGRLFVPWPIEGHGTPIVGTATLAERPAPYVLAVELARGKLNDVRNQLADWTQMGLRSTPELERRPGRGPAGLHPRRHVVGPARGLPGVGPRRGPAGLATPATC